MQTVYLKGELGERFGEKWSMNVDRIHDIFKLIDCQREGYRQYMVDCAENGIDFTVQRGEEFIDEAELLLSVGKEDIIVTPVPQGSKGNVGKLIMAAALIAAGMYGLQYLQAGAGWTLPSTATGSAGTVGVSQGTATAIKIASWTAITLGTSLGLRTLGEMLLPDDSSDNEDDSHLFSGPQNTTVQGGAVPVLYGEMIVGGTLINSSYRASGAPQSWGPAWAWRQPLGIDSGEKDQQTEQQ
jgi:predicted phage tail protein